MCGSVPGLDKIKVTWTCGPPICAAMFPQKFSPATTFTTPGVTGARGVPHPASTAAAASRPAANRRATPAYLCSGIAMS